MKSIISIVALLISIGAGYWGWTKGTFSTGKNELKVEEKVGIKKSDNIRVKEIDEDVVSASNENYEVKLLDLFPAEGYVGKDLYRRLESLQKWLDSLKVHVIDKLGLDILIYAQYVENRFKFSQRRIGARDQLRKRYGDFQTFSREYAKLRIEINREYFEKLEEIFGDNFNDLMKFHRAFNDKIKVEEINRYEEFYTIDL
ncbi:MAG: hypothetical protein KAG61_01355 [Bacteriovoracaceae bacterium]|nr:hypothetical protein [Bacteriovoracaceae bacterium]